MEEKDVARSLLRELRETQGRSLRGVASDLNVDPSYLSRLERGERGYSEELRLRLSSYYGVPSDILALNEGSVPADILEILKAHPEELSRLRREYGDR
ncbi:helix-turn-helix domain-containing protein [Micromonospora matsumotoense]|uniref:helix-turn-helix domain-containing protein n=1 Tax=Micromonospora matsumotoense TaxID=121616 RepID=UPI003D9201A4